MDLLSEEALSERVSQEISDLLAAPPPWLDGASANDVAPSRMQPTLQRGRNRWARAAWRWECNVRGPVGSPYVGTHRILVRVPVGYPLMPPRLQVLSIISHLEVETRDPFDGALDDSFYERLEERRKGRLASAAPPPNPPSLADEMACSKRPIEAASGAPTTGRTKRPKNEAGVVSADGTGSSSGGSHGDNAPAAAEEATAEVAAEAEAATAERQQSGYTLALALELFVEALNGPLPTRRATMRAFADDAAADDAAAADDDDDDAAGGVSSAGGTDGADANIFDEEAAREAAAGTEEREASYALAWSEVAASHADDVQTCAAYRELCLHPELFNAAPPTAEWFAPSFAEAFSHGPPSEATLRALVEEVCPGIFVFDFLSHSFCERLLCELEHYESTGLPVVRPNSMNNYGVVLNSIGMEKTIDALQRQCVSLPP